MGMPDICPASGAADAAGAAAAAAAEGIPAWPPARADLTSHKNITRPLCTLSGPTNRSIPDRKMVTECAKSVPAPRDAPGWTNASGRRAAAAAASSSMRDLRRFRTLKRPNHRGKLHRVALVSPCQ